MTDHRRRAEVLTYLFVGNKADVYAISMVEKITSALKEVEEETWARALEVVDSVLCGHSWDACDCFDDAKKLLREEAAKK